MSVKQKHHHTPTRICPHRLCLPLHLGVGVIAIIDVIVLLTRGDAGQSLGNISMFWLISVVIGVAGYAVSRVVLGQSTGQLMRLDQLDRARGIHLVARPVWAAVAAATDAFNVVLAGACGALALAGQTGPSEMTSRGRRRPDPDGQRDVGGPCAPGAGARRVPDGREPCDAPGGGCDDRDGPFHRRPARPRHPEHRRVRRVAAADRRGLPAQLRVTLRTAPSATAGGADRVSYAASTASSVFVIHSGQSLLVFMICMQVRRFRDAPL